MDASRRRACFIAIIFCFVSKPIIKVLLERLATIFVEALPPIASLALPAMPRCLRLLWDRCTHCFLLANIQPVQTFDSDSVIPCHPFRILAIHSSCALHIDFCVESRNPCPATATKKTMTSKSFVFRVCYYCRNCSLTINTNHE